MDAKDNPPAHRRTRLICLRMICLRTDSAPESRWSDSDK